jgi:hypothetical protein
MRDLIKHLFEHKILTVILTMLVCLVIVLLINSVTLGIHTFYPYEPIRIDRLDIDKTECSVGDTVCVQMVGEKLLPLPVRVTLSLVNGSSITIETYWSNSPVGNKFRSRCFNVPFHIATNWYQVQWDGAYPINNNRTVYKQVLSKPIYVTNNLRGSLRGDTGKTGLTGDKGEKGDTGGISIFGKGERGEMGPRGYPGKDK